MKLTRIVATVLATAMIFAVGCAPANSSTPQNPSSQVPLTESERFEQLLDEEFRESVSSSLIDSRFLMENPESYGVVDVPNTMGSINFEDIENTAKYWQEGVDELASFDYEQLTKDQQLIYDLLEYQSQLQEPMLAMTYYNEINSPLLGIQSQLPTLLSEFKLYTVQDVEDYIEMLGTAKSYFDDMARYQSIRSEKGLFMSDRMAKSVIDFCREFAQSGEENMLIETFPERLDIFDELTDEQRNKLIEDNKQAVQQSVLPAYAALADAMEKLLGTGVGDVGMSALPNGKEYYEYLVASMVGSDLTVEEIKERVDTQLQSSRLDMFMLVVQDRDLVDEIEKLDSSKEVPEQVMEDLIESCKGRFPELTQLQYSIKYVHPSLEASSSPAFYYIPPIDSTGDNSIYINRSNIDSYYTLYSLLGHEGYPGHMYQNNYVVQMQTHPIRRLMDCVGFGEGWGIYAEDMAYEFAGIENPHVVQLLRIENDMNMLLSTRADIGVNYEGWDVDRLAEMLAEYGFDDKDTAENIYNIVVEEPAYYLKYNVGYLELKELRSLAQEALGDSFDELEFHRTILDLGSVPFKFVRRAVEGYISEGMNAVADKAA